MPITSKLSLEEKVMFSIANGGNSYTPMDCYLVPFVRQTFLCLLRSYIRQRDNLIRSSCVHVPRMQKALTEMNLQLHKVRA